MTQQAEIARLRGAIAKAVEYLRAINNAPDDSDELLPPWVEADRLEAVLKLTSELQS